MVLFYSYREPPEPEPQPVAPGRTKKKYGGVQVLPSGMAAVPVKSAPSVHSSSTSRSATPEPAPRAKHETIEPVEAKPEYDLPPEDDEEEEEEEKPAVLPYVSFLFLLL